MKNVSLIKSKLKYPKPREKFANANFFIIVTCFCIFVDVGVRIILLLPHFAVLP